MYTVAIDTTSRAFGVALLENESVRAEVYLNTNNQHSVSLLPVINYVLEQTGIKIDATDLFVCSSGPGSFTGLRVGLSTIKGMAMALNKPVIELSSLQVLAANISIPSADICPMLDAQRNQVYTGIYRLNKTMIPSLIGEEQITEVTAFLKKLKGKAIFLGSGATMHADRINEIMPERSTILPEYYHYCRAAIVGKLGMNKFCQGKTIPALLLTPRYLHASEAEKKRILTPEATINIDK